LEKNGKFFGIARTPSLFCSRKPIPMLSLLLEEFLRILEHIFRRY